METKYDAFIYARLSIYAPGILGNTLVIISILTQRRLLKNNYYFLVQQLAICDLAWLVANSFDAANYLFVKKQSVGVNNTMVYCFFYRITFFFQVAGICLMLIISILRYRATVHPLKPAMSRRKLKAVCCFCYIIALFAGYGILSVTCLKQMDVEIYWRFIFAYAIFFFYFAPTVFMAIVYYKIGRALVKQKKCMKTARSNPATENPSSFNIMKYVRYRRTYFVCLTTVLCYGFGNLPVSVWFVWFIAGIRHLTTKYTSIYDVGLLLRVAGSCTANPLIYGILDKKLLTFWKFCRKKKYRAQQTAVNRQNETRL